MSEDFILIVQINDMKMLNGRMPVSGKEPRDVFGGPDRDPRVIYSSDPSARRESLLPGLTEKGRYKVLASSSKGSPFLIAFSFRSFLSFRALRMYFFFAE